MYDSGAVAAVSLTGLLSASRQNLVTGTFFFTKSVAGIITFRCLCSLYNSNLC